MKQKFNVTGMTCSACSAHVEKAVRQVEGVDSVSVNLLGNSMLVEYGGKTGPRGLRALFRQLDEDILQIGLLQRHLQQGNPRPGKGEEEGAGDVVEACLPSGFEARGDETALLRRDGPGVDPKLGDYTFEEVLKTVYHQMGVELTSKKLAAKVQANVEAEQHLALRLMPLFLKNIAMKLVYDAVGERNSCLTLSNLGAVTLPRRIFR